MGLNLSGHLTLYNRDIDIEKRLGAGDYDMATVVMNQNIDYMVEQFVKVYCPEVHAEPDNSAQIYSLKKRGVIDESVYQIWTEIRKTRNDHIHDSEGVITGVTREQASVFFQNLLQTERFFIDRIPQKSENKIPFQYLSDKERRKSLEEYIRSFPCVEDVRSFRGKKDGVNFYSIRFLAKEFPERSRMLNSGWLPGGVGIKACKIIGHKNNGNEAYTVLLCDKCCENAVIRELVPAIRFWDQVNRESENEIRARIAEPWLDEQKRQKELREQQRKENEERQKEYAKNLKKGIWRNKITDVAIAILTYAIPVLGWVVIIAWIWGMFH